MTRSSEPTQPVGGTPHRVGGVERVTGAQRYVADLELPGALHVELVTLDCARASLISIDKTEAERVPGVVMVMTAETLPQPVPRFGPQHQD
ncbi:MAG: xanthine dehydrogenase family protein molybdopterin-binding subunit, partial [Acidimicrobiia bacterium]